MSEPNDIVTTVRTPTYRHLDRVAAVRLGLPAAAQRVGESSMMLTESQALQ